MATNPFRKLHPSDGYRISRANLGQTYLSLQVGLYQKGELQPFARFDGEQADTSHEIWSQEATRDTDYAVQHRVELAAEALCRYFNAGGSWEELRPVLEQLGKFIPTGLSIPGWELYDMDQDAEGDFYTVWVDEERREVVRWWEGLSIDTGIPFEDFIDEACGDDPEEEFKADLRALLGMPDVPFEGDAEDPSQTDGEADEELPG